MKHFLLLISCIIGLGILLMVIMDKSLLADPAITESQEVAIQNIYDEEIMQTVRKSLGIDPQSIVKDDIIMNKSKAEVLAMYYEGKGMSELAEEVKQIVYDIYGYDLDQISSYLLVSDGNSFLQEVEGKSKASTSYSERVMRNVTEMLQDTNIPNDKRQYIMSLSKSEVFDLYFAANKGIEYAEEAKAVILSIYGLDLEKIAEIQDIDIAISSKGIWITRSEEDLFVMHSTINDVGLKIYPTSYFTELTGLYELPKQVRTELEEIGFYYKEDIGAYYYEDPNDIPITESFKINVVNILSNYMYNNNEQMI
ncbi:hypothetical protein [Pontibacillus litoralis]|uniref:Uncharacterized protein n=1 Tax=Pontibacillus litoralis JSM 072002 TaxID=1385512 RepID=A0A0A5G6Z7_9BACI|nr:hypothetical protein [Pontibacillus litoralis]KGX86938.1 hypothetical protein N784_03300 [Pontibacillus litoralis JSM 072002]